MSELGDLKGAAKQAFTLRNVALFLFSAVIIFVIADFIGLTNWVLYPVTTAKAKIAERKAKG